MFQEAKAEHSSSAGSWDEFYSEFRIEDSVFNIEKLYNDYRSLQSLELTYSPNRKPDDKKREKDHNRWLLLKGVFERLKEVYDEQLLNPGSMLSEGGIDDLPPHFSKALGIFNQLERFLSIDIKILHEVSPESNTEKLTQTEVEANHVAQLQVMSNLEEQLKFFQSFSDKDPLKKISYIFSCANSLFKEPSPRNEDDDHRIRRREHSYSSQQPTLLYDPLDTKRLATAAETLRRVQWTQACA